jgi:hypothetical protein
LWNFADIVSRPKAAKFAMHFAREPNVVPASSAPYPPSVRRQLWSDCTLASERSMKRQTGRRQSIVDSK